MKRSALLCALLLLLAPTFALAKTTINIWHAYRGKEEAALKKVVDAFNQKGGEIEIQLLGIPYDAFADKITAAIPRDKGPDLFIAAHDRIGDWAAKQVIEPVDFWLTDDIRGRYLPPTMKALTYDDAVYGLPMAFKMVVLFYNPALVPSPPATTDDMIAAAKKATDAGKQRFGLVYENANFYYQMAWMHGFGGEVFNKRGKPTLGSDEVINSLAFARRLARDEGIMPQEVTASLVTTLFNKGQAGMVISGPWFMGEIDPSVRYQVATLPTISQNGKKAQPALTAEAIIMSAKSAHKKEAFEVMQYLTGVEAGVVMATEGRQPVARREVYDDARVKGDATLQVFRRQLDTAVPMPNTPAMLMVWSPMTTAMNKVINGDTPPADAAKAAQEEIAKLVKGARR
ncbi:MAG: extracellular solute-binding protein [bacterium]|nr:extracellular solute-binding protein [Myxococcales bacterium]MCB9542132.1 extracellular solute-binding protein [Myxococcales bacterium]